MMFVDELFGTFYGLGSSAALLGDPIYVRRVQKPIMFLEGRGVIGACKIVGVEVGVKLIH